MADETTAAGPEPTINSDTKLALLSKVVKTGSVETFNWEYKDSEFINGRKTGVTVTRKVQDLQAILINPKWAEHGFDTFAGTTTADSQDSDNKPAGAATHIGQKKPAYTAAMGKKLKPNKADKSDYAEIRSAFSGLKIE